MSNDLNDEQERVLATICADTRYEENYFITGPAGTGKSYILRHIADWLFKVRGLSIRHVAFVAPTGIAAINIGGRTIHSLFSIDPYFDYTNVSLSGKTSLNFFKKSFLILERLLESIAAPSQSTSALRILIIDEISMVSKRLLAHVHHKCGGYDNGRPFGGKQLIVFGDFLQLPPVIDSKKTGGGDQCFVWRGEKVLDGYAFDSELWRSCDFVTLSLTRVVRQQDQEFSACLAELRYGRLTARTVKLLLKNLRLKEYKHKTKKDSILPTILHGTISHVNEMNEIHFSKLDTPVHRVDGSFSWFAANGTPISSGLSKLENLFSESVGVPRTYKIRVGAQILYRVNTRNLGLVNGSRGVVEDIILDENGRVRELVVRFTDDRLINIGYKCLTRTLYSSESRALVILSYNTIPVCLAWAMTIHKAQSLTLCSVALNLSKSSIFLPHQAYVALSRARALKDVYLSAIDFGVFTVDKQTLKFQRENIDNTMDMDTDAKGEDEDENVVPIGHFDYHDLLKRWPLLEPLWYSRRDHRVNFEVDAAVHGSYQLENGFFSVIQRVDYCGRGPRIRDVQQVDVRDIFEYLTSVCYNFDTSYSLEFLGKSNNVSIHIRNRIKNPPVSIVCSGIWPKMFPTAKSASRLEVFEFFVNNK